MGSDRSSTWKKGSLSLGSSSGITRFPFQAAAPCGSQWICQAPDCVDWLKEEKSPIVAKFWNPARCLWQWTAVFASLSWRQISNGEPSLSIVRSFGISLRLLHTRRLMGRLRAFCELSKACFIRNGPWWKESHFQRPPTRLVLYLKKADKLLGNTSSACARRANS